MPTIITITNNKGGTGKTATTVNLAAALRLRGYNILIIDCDGQANATISLGVEASKGGTVYDLMRNTSTDPNIIRIMDTDGGCGYLDLIPSCTDLSAIESELADADDRLNRLGEIVGKLPRTYDVILIDTPPMVGILTISALCAADFVIIPTQPQFLALRGFVALMDVIGMVNTYKGRELDKRVLFTQYDKRKSLHRTSIEQVKNAGFDVFATLIRDNVALAEAPAVGVDIFRYAPRSKGAEDYAALADEIINIKNIGSNKKK